MELPIFNTYINFSRHHFCCFTVAPLFVLDKSTAWNRCLQHPCFKNLCKITQAFKNSNAQHFLSDLLTHSWFHSMLFTLPGYQFPYTVMNRCFYLTDFIESTWKPPWSPMRELANGGRTGGEHRGVLAMVLWHALSCVRVILIWRAPPNL